MISNAVNMNDLVGLHVNNFTVISFSEKRGNSYYYLCVCDCGNKFFARRDRIKDNTTKSCGCKRIVKSKTHNMSNTRFYSIWTNMKTRCGNPNNHKYKIYGGRGIIMCSEWLNFINFKNDMYDSYSIHIEQFGEKDTTIDRINVNGNYCKENCKWSTNIEQARNKRNNKWIKAVNKNGEEYIFNNVNLFAKQNNIQPSSVRYYLNHTPKFRRKEIEWNFNYIKGEK